jgi:hypothetical protein
MRRIEMNKTRIVAGTAGLTAVLAGGVYLIVGAVTGGATATTSAQATSGPASTSGVASGSPGKSSARSDVMGPALPGPSLTPIPTSTAERLARVRDEAKKHTVKVKHPLIKLPAAPGEVAVTDHGSVQQDGKTLRIVTARKDLTGYDELAWVADDGTKVGNARCSQKFRLSNEEAPEERPTLLLCWRTSEKKSVYTVAVDVKKRPSKAESVAAIDRAWSRLG